MTTRMSRAPTDHPRNRLAREASPYLQQHADNPVDWYAWGAEALARARAEDKPILLSIGYSACHWCHVMERESFADAAIAAQMNAAFVNIKVDREERPDLDHIYQLVVQLLGRSGGWPLTVFLTPDQRPFFGGTYFPPIERYGMPSFSSVLDAASSAYAERREEVAARAEELTQAIHAVSRGEGGTAGEGAPGPDLLDRATRPLLRRFDETHGGFGTKPKFPSTMALELLLRRGALEGDAPSLERVRMTLERMAQGGVYDQLGGGFHRYSTDERWLVPHFEKMLYDNALLMRLYVEAHRVSPSAPLASTIRDIAGYVAREMTSPSGAFYATQDADSEGEEGKFFVWDAREIGDALEGDQEAARVAIAHFGVTDAGNFERTGKTVLHLSRSAEAVAARLDLSLEAVRGALGRARVAMLAARERRPRPFRDEKILAGWNGLMIGALAEAGAALGDDALVSAAERALSAVCALLVTRDGGGARVKRLALGERVQGEGFLDDYAQLACGALDLYEATGAPEHVELARALVDAIDERFVDDEGVWFSPADGESLITRAMDAFDAAVPSGFAMTMRAHLRLGALVDPAYVELAQRELDRLWPRAIHNPMGLAQSLCETHRLVAGSTEVVLVGARNDPRTRALAAAALGRFLPNRTIAWLDPTDAASRNACAALADGKAARSEPVAYVCRGRTCSLPVADARALVDLLARA
jgi:uncharacterized protein